MTRYTTDAVAMARYTVDRLPSAVDDIFGRAEEGLDVVEAPSVTVAEAVWVLVNNGVVAGVPVETTPDEVLRGLVHDGPVVVSDAGESDVGIAGSLMDQHTMMDALLIANHRVRGTEAILTRDSAFVGEATVWD